MSGDPYRELASLAVAECDVTTVPGLPSSTYPLKTCGLFESQKPNLGDGLEGQGMRNDLGTVPEGLTLRGCNLFELPWRR